MKYTENNLAKCLRSANWNAIQNPNMEYRVTVDESGDLRVTEWLEHSSSYREGEKYLFTSCYWPGVDGNPSMEQHAFIEQIPQIIEEIKHQR